MRPKLLWLSDSALFMTGFSTESKELCKRMHRSGWDVSYAGNGYAGQELSHVKFADGEEIPFRILTMGRQPYGADSIQPHIRKIKPDIFGVLLDTFMLYPWLLPLDLSPAKTVMWFPSDGGWFPLDCEKILQKFQYPVAMAKAGRDQLKDEYKIDCHYIPHGVMEDLYYPLKPQEREACKARYGAQGKFVVGCVSRNQGRKMLDRQIKAFAEFSKNKNDVVMLMHSDPQDAASPWNLRMLAKRFGCESKIIWTGMTFLDAYTTTDMRNVYNAMDVHFLTTCFTPDTPVQTNEGIKNIVDIKIGDRVLTSAGKYREVQDLIEEDHKGEILRIKADGLPEVKCTPNHRIYRVKCKDSNDKKRVVEKPKLVLEKAETLSKYDYLAYPIPKKQDDLILNSISTVDYIIEGRNQFGAVFSHPRSHKLPSTVELDYDFGFLCGTYLAEGCSTKDGIALCFNTNETAYYTEIEKILKSKFSLTTRLRHNTRHRTTLWVNNSSIGRMFSDLFGSNSHIKKLPKWILDSPKDFKQGLVTGLWQGDGCYWKRKDYNGYTFELQLVAKQLIHQMFNLLISEGFMPSISMQKRTSDVWRLRINNYQNFGEYAKIEQVAVKKKKTRFFKDSNFVYYPISSIKKEKYEGKVYDLTVDKEHNYCNYFLVKNSGEGFGIPFIEAMACEIPNVATDYTSTRELVTDWNAGLAIPLVGTEERPYPMERNWEGTLTGSWNVDRGLCSVKKATEALQYMYENPAERIRMGKNGRKAVFAEYSWEGKVWPRWQKLMAEIMSK